MTKEITTSGIIIKETKVGEGNKIFTILTSDYGKIQASGAGVRSYKSKLGSGCSLFCYSDFILKQGKSKDIYSIVSADKKMDFFDLRFDIEKLSLVNYICDLTNYIAMPETDCSNILRLLLNTIYYIHKNDLYLKIKPTFELRLMCEAGFAPNLSSCHRCGSLENLCFFSVDFGSAECGLCKKSSNMSADTKAAMEFICSSSLKSVFNFTISENVIAQLSVITEQYVLHHLGKVPKSLTYLKSLK